ncbi:hypothetical protein PT2222_70141 [Paraburkholderia tropica]
MSPYPPPRAHSESVGGRRNRACRRESAADRAARPRAVWRDARPDRPSATRASNRRAARRGGFRTSARTAACNNVRYCRAHSKPGRAIANRRQMHAWQVHVPVEVQRQDGATVQQCAVQFAMPMGRYERQPTFPALSGTDRLHRHRCDQQSI